MPIVRKTHANKVQRRVSPSQPSLRRPVTSVAIAKENGTVRPTKPRYSKTGWKAISGLSCRSGFGREPSTGTRPMTCANGFAGPAMRAKKKTATQSPIRLDHATSGSDARLRNTWVTAARYPARMSAQSRIEPWRADHMPVMEYSAGVSRLLLAATKAIEKSWFKSARSMPMVARTAPASTQRANVRAWRNNDCRPVASPTPIVTTPATAASRPSATPTSQGRARIVDMVFVPDIIGIEKCDEGDIVRHPVQRKVARGTRSAIALAHNDDFLGERLV